jgi:hypothetical protein
LVVDGPGGVHDAADRRAPLTDVVVQPRLHLIGVGDIDARDRHARTEAFGFADRVDRRPMRVGIRKQRPPAPWGDLASAQQGDMPRPSLGEVGRDDAAQRSGPTGDDIRRIGREFGREGFGEVAARAQPRHELHAPPDGDLILAAFIQNVFAGERGGLAIADAVDVDEPAPVLDEFLVADDSAESPDGRLLNGRRFVWQYRLSVGGQQVEAGRNGFVVREGLEQMQYRENADVLIRFVVGADVQRPAVDDPGEVTLQVEVFFDELVQLLGLPRVERVPSVELGQDADGIMRNGADPLAVAAHLVGERCPESARVEEYEPRKFACGGRRLTGVGAFDPLQLEEPPVDAFGRRARRGAE